MMIRVYEGVYINPRHVVYIGLLESSNKKVNVSFVNGKVDLYTFDTKDDAVNFIDRVVRANNSLDIDKSTFERLINTVKFLKL